MADSSWFRLGCGFRTGVICGAGAMGKMNWDRAARQERVRRNGGDRVEADPGLIRSRGGKVNKKRYPPPIQVAGCGGEHRWGEWQATSAYVKKRVCIGSPAD